MAIADDIASLKVLLADIKADQKVMVRDIADIKERMVTKERFRPVEAITYGLVIAAVATVTAVVRSIFAKGA